MGVERSPILVPSALSRVVPILRVGTLIRILMGTALLKSRDPSGRFIIRIVVLLFLDGNRQQAQLPPVQLGRMMYRWSRATAQLDTLRTVIRAPGMLRTPVSRVRATQPGRDYLGRNVFISGVSLVTELCRAWQSCLVLKQALPVLTQRLAKKLALLALVWVSLLEGHRHNRSRFGEHSLVILLEAVFIRPRTPHRVGASESLRVATPQSNLKVVFPRKVWIPSPIRSKRISVVIRYIVRT